MSLHLVLKFRHHAWNRDDRSIVTIDEHLRLLSSKGGVWWGRTSTISQEKFEEILHQLEAGIPTYAFLYETHTPAKISKNGRRWYLAKISRIKNESPQEKSLIPEYYRESPLSVAFLLESIELLPYDEGKLPKVPGQTAIRFVNIESGAPKPENLTQAVDGKKLCTENTAKENIQRKTETQKEPLLQGTNETQIEQYVELLEENRDLQRTISELKDEVKELNSYKENYNKVLKTDFLFSSEKLLEIWLSEKLHSILPNIELIDRQPRATWPDGKFGRLDLLGFNKDTKKLTIIEVKTKKRNKKTAYDQFVRYTTWAKSHIDEISNKYPQLEKIDKDDVDFVLITDLQNKEMEAICQHHDIQLVRLFGGLGYEVLG